MQETSSLKIGGSPVSEDMRLFYPARGRRKCAQPNYEYFDVKGRSIRHYRLQYLYDEYRQACELAGDRPYALSSFKEGLRTWRNENVKSQTPEWFPGEYLQCYWARLRSYASSRSTICSFFVARLPYSGYTYIRAVEDLSCRTWMQMCMEAYHFFGGVPYVTEYHTNFDKAKKGNNDPPLVLPTLQAFATHYRTVLHQALPKTDRTASRRREPLAPRQPRWPMRYVRANLKISETASIEELNEHLSLLVDQINGMSKGGRPSARETFERYEAPQLLTLPEEDYDMSIWTERIVRPDYHFRYEKMLFSVPYIYAYETVRIRVAKDYVEAYVMGSLIARHDLPDKSGGRRLFTDPSHRPLRHRTYAKRLYDHFMSLALDAGPATGAIMKETLAICDKKGVYRRCKDLIDLRNMPSGISLEEACALVLEREMDLSVESAMRIMKEGTV